MEITNENNKQFMKDVTMKEVMKINYVGMNAIINVIS